MASFDHTWSPLHIPTYITYPPPPVARCPFDPVVIPSPRIAPMAPVSPVHNPPYASKQASKQAETCPQPTCCRETDSPVNLCLYLYI